MTGHEDTCEEGPEEGSDEMRGGVAVAVPGIDRRRASIGDGRSGTSGSPEMSRARA